MVWSYNVSLGLKSIESIKPIPQKHIGEGGIQHISQVHESKHFGMGASVVTSEYQKVKHN